MKTPQSFIFLLLTARLVAPAKTSLRGSRSLATDLPPSLKKYDTLVDRLLPDLQVDVLKEEEPMVQGTLTVGNQKELLSFYSKNFISDNEQRASTIVFQCNKELAMASDEMDGWCGFQWTTTEDSSISIVLSRYDDKDDITISMMKEKGLDKDAVEAIESLVSSRLSAYFVGLYYKLVAMGKYKTSKASSAYEMLYFQALWMSKLAD